MNKKGFILIELIIAISLLGMLGSLLPKNLISGIQVFNKVNKKIQQGSASYRAFTYLEKDLRGAVDIQSTESQFTGAKIVFTKLKKIKSKSGVWLRKPMKILYRQEGDLFVRYEQDAVGGNQSPEKKILLNDVEDINFKFPYRDTNGLETYEDFWVESSTVKIPRVVLCELSMRNIPFVEKWISIPQGKWGSLHAT